MNWDGWTLSRILILFTALAYLLIGIQVTLFHYRQNFHKKSMWVPVITAPIFFIVGTVLSLYFTAWLNLLFIGLMWLGVLVGLVGFYFHFRGVGIRIGGRTLRNFLIGPPVILPLMFSALGVLGIIATYWG